MRKNLIALIDRQAIIHNIGILKAARPRHAFCAAIKCNAYGHGTAAVLPAMQQAGVDMLAVANTAEAEELRMLGWSGPILMFGSELSIYPPQEKKNVAFWLVKNEIRVTPMRCCDIQSLVEAAEICGKKVKLHLNLDTGMHRMGLDEQGIYQIINEFHNCRQIEFEGLYTHLAAADEKDKSFALEQIARFKKFANAIKANGINVRLRHLSNSAATIDIAEDNCNMTRCGISVYGYQPGVDMHNRPELRPAMKLVSYLQTKKPVRTGCIIGYGTGCVAKHDMITGIVPIGYGDGYDRRLSNRGMMKIANTYVPVVGRVSMDQTIVDLTHIAGQVEIGDEVTVIDNDPSSKNSVESIAAMLGTIPYEITTGIGSRVLRRATP